MQSIDHSTLLIVFTTSLITNGQLVDLIVYKKCKKEREVLYKWWFSDSVCVCERETENEYFKDEFINIERYNK
uniref:Uncharacterized protein n=1 Tax=Heterorhabditis bacteriophora TaxID=37862 RepID=A0A1I7WCI3_HETBA